MKAADPTEDGTSAATTQLHLLPGSRGWRRASPVLCFAVGAFAGAATASISWAAGLAANRSWPAVVVQQSSTENTPELVDFHFQILNISSPRQSDKILNVFVKWRYLYNDLQCPFSQSDNNCIQYQIAPRSFILNVTGSEQPGLPLGAEWERVALYLCRGLWSSYSLAALSVLLQVNGDGRSWVEAYEPGAHGATCTIGPPGFEPEARFNFLPDFVDGDIGPGKPAS